MKIKINNLVKKYHQKTVINNLSLELDCGIYGLVGPNGAGKSTLMNILSGLISFNSGTIENDEFSFLSNEYYQKFGYLPQYNALYPNFTCVEFLKYLSVLKEVDELKRIDEVLRLVNLEDKKNIKIKKLSGGMKQRLSIAQVLLNDPKFILLDEPTAGLDPRERIRLKNILSQLSKDKIIIVSTHIISDMENLADKIILLKNGTIIANQNSEDLINQVKDYFYSVSISKEELEYFKRKYLITHIQSIKDGYLIKFISDELLQYERTLQITLEDVYLYHYGDKDD